MQATIKNTVRFDGVGLHSGRPVRMVISPASAGYGIWFKRTDIRFGDAMVPARWDAVDRSPLCTRIRNAAGVEVSTIEHVMAALAGCGIHNALIEIDGPEVPILDGSAAPFVDAILGRGIRRLDTPVMAIKVDKTVTVETDSGWARLSPADTFTMSFHIDFTDAAIGSQDKRLVLSNGTFVRELCDSRTFCRQADVDAMRANGLALGGTLENAVVVDGDKVLSPGGLRHSDEPVRHKMLDALGDLALAGAPILGHYTGHRAGHSMTNMLLHALFNTPGALRLVEVDGADAARLPGVGVVPQDMPAVA
ncbi:MAG: UDP-3-O-acyl-N-acetylglucosamine deacetylase [Marinovum algicola]|jgi:UDP-3-O-[3-hydroxymyristoyl] N-acetylglucosamine deacetylase|uniref:UDP-3-O-acyl-N-acetylglucosamine deacetylase n=1 Tax=Marinovum algicola TaxID=42444 RepID=A0A975W7X1_9RHOB|nr:MULTISPECIES: UDP-3-O-acyl-N-acetylglucosamine deacetylase [Marinovum]AKO96267.1 UDP-3-0-acyl N-acetylglucosamine deacetylase [Marinovum algicola DG 898]MDD9738748.1 UDP-3-O-acyl-N-acetylglucosamine deacetylase [Marinovum sp. SP66]MDD9743407.1 UDP-3-O-acyl-N-acetylglucosamine deacetylase [Marinovum sp. PR37]SEI93728.1 UDP-3-O-[3-hydroxymyristoyl] N-acetylglucosamine deacetylase [Marinovum algicola]SLN11351.1 UDP-3-O-[3-hydroxymyristoyl] N-acetylglucosamine deacetylase [Marinovum algicola]